MLFSSDHKPDIRQLAPLWGLSFVSLCPECEISGSPERTSGRWVFSTPEASRFLLEEIPESRRHVKENRIRLIRHLFDAGLTEVIPYCTGINGSPLQKYQNRWWQLLPYLENRPLQRPEYTGDRWRGHAMAEFLIRLQSAISDLPPQEEETPRSLPEYIDRLMGTLLQRSPGIASRFMPCYRHVSSHLFCSYSGLQKSMCHGDFHPLNVIWGDRRIRAVIDWEFSTLRPVLYDAANLLGCIGFENPAALTGDMAEGFITTLQADPFFAAGGWEAMVDLTLALRFAWLSEWMRTNDGVMIDMEADYMDLILKNRATLIHCWTDGVAA